ncbi:MAG: hypothetical protein AAF447_15550 [Myxococcota bacterium]
MTRFVPWAGLLVIGACAAPIDGVASERAPLVRKSAASAELALRELPAGCEDRLAGEDVVIEVLAEHPDLAVARVDGVETCVDAAAALIADLTEGDEEAEEIAFSRYEAAREDPAAEHPSAEGLAVEGTAAEGTAAEGTAAEGTAAEDTAAEGLAAEDLASEADVSAVATPAEAAGGDPHPVPMNASDGPAAEGTAAESDPHPVPMNVGAHAAKGDPHPVPMDRTGDVPCPPIDDDPVPGDAAQGDPHPVPMDRAGSVAASGTAASGTAASGTAASPPPEPAPVAEGPAADAQATQGDPHPVPMDTEASPRAAEAETSKPVP